MYPPLDAEIAILTAEAGPPPLHWRQLRRAERRVMRELATVYADRLATHATTVAPLPRAA